jgi:hypothetical protein
MRNIKLKIAAVIIVLMALVGTCIAQDSANMAISSPWGDSINLEIGVKAEPLVVTVEKQPVEENEILQEVLKVETEQTDALIQNLVTFNNTFKQLPELQIEATQQMLDLYRVYPNIISDKYARIHIVFYCLLLIWWGGWSWKTLTKRKLYWSSNKRWSNTVLLVLGSIAIGYILPKLFCLVFIEHFHLWSNIDKLF